MFQSAFNIGIDRAVQLVDANNNSYTFDMSGNPGSLGRLVSFESKPTVDVVENPAISDGGVNDSMVEWKDWKGTITLDRRNANADSLFAQFEAAYHAGQPQLKFTIHETTANRDRAGQVTYTTFIYPNASIWLDDAGTWALGTRPEVKLMFHATGRVQA